MAQSLEDLWKRARSGVSAMLPVVTEEQYAALRLAQKAGLYAVLDSPADSLVLTHAVLLAVAKWKDVQALPAVTCLAGLEKGSHALAEVWSKAREFLLHAPDVASDPEEELLEAARQCRASLQEVVAERAQQSSLLRASDKASANQPETLLRPVTGTSPTPSEPLLRATRSPNGDTDNSE